MSTRAHDIHQQKNAPFRLSTGEKWADNKGRLWAVCAIDGPTALVRDPLMKSKRVRANPAPRGWRFVDAEFAHPHMKKVVFELLEAFDDEGDIDKMKPKDARAALKIVKSRLQHATEGHS